MSLPTPRPPERGDILTRPNYQTGRVLGVLDRDKLLANVPAMVARIAIGRFHDMSEERRAHAGIAKTGPSAPNHYHGELTRVDPPEWDDGEPQDGMRVVLSTESTGIKVRQLSGAPILDYPVNPVYIVEK